MNSGLADPEFVRLGEALQALDGRQARVRRAAATMACAVPALRDRLPVLAELPTLAVSLSPTALGERMEAKYGGHRRGVPRRLAVSVLALPECGSDYLRGRSRQAVRTNGNRAIEAGVTCRRMGRVEADVRITAVLRARGEDELVGSVREDLHDGLVQAWLARDAEDATEVVALTSVDGPFARLDLMLAAPGREAGPARYLLSSHLVAELAGRGVRHLAVDTALFLQSGLRHFQRLLGFVPMTLELTRGPQPDDDCPAPRISPASGPVPTVSAQAPAARRPEQYPAPVGWPAAPTGRRALPPPLPAPGWRQPRPLMINGPVRVWQCCCDPRTGPLIM
ncbi:hypothetical protein LQ327_10475 [Actinomycetospora endophytica]|uniref:Acetyltransferase (GNAT) family protein n=1 Tax=Actinomycetospora endophytica TaxID=2291215 RepID=A0ABS8P6B1_9PSEU|nr:hypothetical protein [Actinomycetospora endophytica]MCD2193799.1 hypothetical protein [Actinomycetospora endophytica]